MVDFYDDEHKAIEGKYNDLRELVARIGAEGKPLHSVLPELMATTTGTPEEPEVTAALVVATAKGSTQIEALTNLEAALRIAAFGVQADATPEFASPIDVTIDAELVEDDEPTLAGVVAGLDGDADIGGRESLN